MFTGLVQDLGRVAAVEQGDEGIRLTIETALAGEIAPGDSIAVNGVCLTATSVAEGTFTADVMNVTAYRTSLGGAVAGGVVNVEPALRAADRLGGHIVQGHVDEIGTVTNVMQDGFARLMTIGVDPELLRYVVEKGSIAVDGVSLTVAALDDGSFTVSLIPETLERTNLGLARAGAIVNLEVDVLAKYVERLIAPRGAA